MDVNNCVFRGSWLWRAFKHSDFHTIQSQCADHLHWDRRPCTFLAKDDDEVQAQADDGWGPGSVSVCSWRMRKMRRVCVSFVAVHLGHTHQPQHSCAIATLEDSLATFNKITQCIYLSFLELQGNFLMSLLWSSDNLWAGNVSLVLFYQETEQELAECAHLAG